MAIDFSAFDISIHAPLTGSDVDGVVDVTGTKLFQSTLPSQGATRPEGKAVDANGISIHAPLTGSDTEAPLVKTYTTISIHAPLTGSDNNLHSTHNILIISIHAPLTGSDMLRLNMVLYLRAFQSTLPSQGATRQVCRTVVDISISIHAPLTGSDGHPLCPTVLYTHFNPRSPHRERRYISDLFPLPRYFNPRSPHRERQQIYT